jgi:hypothetical protein
MPNSEAPEQRPSCGYTVRTKTVTGTATGTTAQKCGSEKGLKQVMGKSTWGHDKTTPVCEKHLDNAIRDWHWEVVEPLKR